MKATPDTVCVLTVVVLGYFQLPDQGSLGDERQNGSVEAKPAVDATLRALQEGRIAVLKQCVEMLQFARDSGRRFDADDDAMASVQLQLCEAQLELATTKDERISILEKSLAFWTRIEQEAERSAAVGTALIEQKLLATADRMKAEIALHCAKVAH